MHATTYVWRLELIFSFYLVGPRAGPQAIRLGSMCLDLLGHLISSAYLIFKIQKYDFKLQIFPSIFQSLVGAMHSQFILK